MSTAWRSAATARPGGLFRVELVARHRGRVADACVELGTRARVGLAILPELCNYSVLYRRGARVHSLGTFAPFQGECRRALLKLGALRGGHLSRGESNRVVIVHRARGESDGADEGQPRHWTGFPSLSTFTITCAGVYGNEIATLLSFEVKRLPLGSSKMRPLLS